jgi:hypothetical protein
VKYDAVVFDLLTALIDSWTLWNAVAGSEADGLKWRRRYLEITYGCGADAGGGLPSESIGAVGRDGQRQAELLPGAKTVGMAVYWHNRIGLAPRGDAKPDHLERTLDRLPACI